MLRVFRPITRLAAGLAVLCGSALTAPAFAAGPNLVARITEPFQVGERLVAPGMLSLRPVSSYHPGGTIDELWLDRDFLGLFVADGDRNESLTDHDSVVFERGADGRLILIGYTVRGGRSETAYRYRIGSTAALETPASAGSARSGGLAAR